MSKPEEDDVFNDEFVQEYVRQTWLADYYDGDEGNSEVDGLILESAGMHFVEFDEFGNEIYEENDESSSGEYEDDDLYEEIVDLDDDETYESRVTGNLYSPMHTWQRRALDEWEKNEHFGIIEAVTGSGKTFLGILAAAKALDDGFGVVVVVPTRVLQEQWIDELNLYLAKTDEEDSRIVGGLGGEYGTDLKRKASRPMPGKVVVSVAATYSAKPFFHPGKDEPMLLIADEVHRYSGSSHSKVFHGGFERRLGLTATFEPVLGRYSLYENYFGSSPLFSYTFKNAIEDDVVSEYDVVLIRVLLPPQVKIEYERIWARIQAVEDKLRFYTNISFNSEKVHRDISSLKENSLHIPLVKEWESLNEELDNLLSNKATKESTVKLLAPYIHRWGHTVIFTDYVELAEQLQYILTVCRVYSKLLNYRVKQKDRAEIFDHFEEGRIRSLVSPRVLDEGVNLPLLSFGIFAGVRRRRLQLVQRLGRVLRKAPDKKWPVVCIPVNIGTIEDPKLEGNERLPYSPLSIVLENASDIKIVDARDEEEVRRIFNSLDGAKRATEPDEIVPE
jgi:RNA polymerase primary sigma factor